MGLLHASILASIPNVDLEAVCDSKRLITKVASQLIGKKTKVLNDVSLLSPLELDAVFVTTPISSHKNLVQSILENHIADNVFTEKTLTLNHKDSLQLCELADRGKNTVGYQKLHSVTFKKGLSLLKSGAIGRPQSFKAYSYSSDFIDKSKDKLTALSLERGGILRDLGAHAISLALWYFGELAFGNPKQAELGSLEFDVKANGFAGTIGASWCKEGYRIPETGLIINGDGGRIIVNDDRAQLETNGTTNTWYRQNLDDNVPFLIWASEYYREDQHFIDSIANDTTPNPTFTDAAKVDKLIEKVMENA